MFDDIVRDNLQFIVESLVLIEKRFSKLNNADDFVSSEDGVLVLDAIAMRLQVVGELLKKIDKQTPDLFGRYPEIQWDNIMRLRDIVSHHYEKIDHEIIFDICSNHLPRLKSAVLRIIEKEG